MSLMCFQKAWTTIGLCGIDISSWKHRQYWLVKSAHCWFCFSRTMLTARHVFMKTQQVIQTANHF